jgi:cytosine/adenosine deaminase-related metal-dependent hydrolase
MGCLAANTVLVHGVALSEADVARVIERGASVVWCPSSNLGMMAKTLHPRALFNAGRLALGTDSRLSGSRDLLDELRVAEAHSDLSASELLALVTAHAAHTLRMSDVGGLEEGQIADCMIVREHADPHRNLLETRRSEIRVVVRGGVPLIGDLDFAEWFSHSGVDTVRVRLDGQPKLLARRIARPEVVALEPGLDLD